MGGEAEERAWHDQPYGGSGTSYSAPPPHQDALQEGHREDATRQETETSPAPRLLLLQAPLAPQPLQAAPAATANEEELTAEPNAGVPGSITGVKPRPQCLV